MTGVIPLTVVRRPDMEFSLFARARVQFSDFGQLRGDGNRSRESKQNAASRVFALFIEP